MMIRRDISLCIGALLLIGTAAACRHADPLAATTQPASAPSDSAKPVNYVCTKGGISFSYPGDFSTKTDPDQVLEIARKEQVIRFDLPDLPFHLPGAIPINLVANGFVKDLKKQDSDLKIDENAGETIAGAQARRLRYTYSKQDQKEIGFAVLLVHGDHVYIFQADGQEGQDADTLQTAFNSIIGSIQWAKTAQKPRGK